jgi:hypothetical protein
MRRSCAAAALCLGLASAPAALAEDSAATFYVGRISSVNAWHDLVTAPADAEFVDAYMAVTALSHVLRRYSDDRLSFEVEGQVAYNFGDQHHWEFNLATGPRWHRFPWSAVLATSAAFEVGLSMASEMPEVEVRLEGDSEKLLIYWGAELTLGSPRSPWALSLRLHHRSGGFGLFADDGGMNALALGVRYAF